MLQNCFVEVQTSTSDWYLHGFADASERAYSAVVYFVLPNRSSMLIISKSKVAPIMRQTLPCLELCAVLLLVRLLRYILQFLPSPSSRIQGLTDSEIVLAWLKCHPSKWTTFVANRVSEIVNSFPNFKWLRVKSTDNPADCSTRGYSVSQLMESSLWWHGRSWLITDPISQEAEVVDHENVFSTLAEAEIEVKSTYAVETNHILSTLLKTQRFSNIVRIIAFCLKWRVIHKLKKAGEKRNLSYFTADDFYLARLGIFRLIQQEFYAKEIKLLENKAPLSKDSKLKRLSPFICPQGLLRLGGRLQYFFLSYDEIHPILLPKNCLLVRKLVEHIHRVTLHGGIQLMRSYINRSIWIVGGSRLIQNVYRKCVTCVRFSAQTLKQQMAPLPAVIITLDRPFACSGLDYAGPISVLFSKGRGAKSTSGYISIFVCLVTRAVHIEIVSDLTSAAFLAAYSRFTSRRRLCKLLYSDNGTNFKGAAGELEALFTEASSFSREVAAAIAKDGTKWTFIPPRSPHFGGLWEVAVKSFKYHFRRVIGETRLTFEELSTVSTSIEAILNSRPLCPISNDSNDLVALTPGHFLIGSSLTSILEPYNPSFEFNSKISRVSRWEILIQMRDTFWTLCGYY